MVMLLILFIKSLLRGKLPPYEAVPVLTAAETNFYRALIQSVDRSIIVCPKVRLADVVKPHSSLGGKARYAAFGRIKSKHLDFVLLKADTLRTYGVIELDDKSHEREDRATRDAFVDAALQSASIPILHVKPQRSYDSGALRLQIFSALSPTLAPNPAGVTPARYS